MCALRILTRATLFVLRCHVYKLRCVDLRYTTCPLSWSLCHLLYHSSHSLAEKSWYAFPCKSFKFYTFNAFQKPTKESLLMQATRVNATGRAVDLVLSNPNDDVLATCSVYLEFVLLLH